MSFEVDNIENNEDFTQADFKTRIQAKKFLHVWFTTVKTHRNLYKKRPELYSCCLDERFYSIIKVKD